jgi:hypothetical protein
MAPTLKVHGERYTYPKKGPESPENHGPGWFSGRAEGVVQSWSALIDEKAVSTTF